MTSSMKPELHNVLHWRQRRLEPRPQATCTEDFVNFGHNVLGIYEQTGIQTHTYTLIAILRIPNGGEVMRGSDDTTFRSINGRTEVDCRVVRNLM